AHQQGLVHRDVKPQNVLLNGELRAKVTDFGIARSLDVQHGMTQTGTVLGTSDYIAPEQAQGQRVDEHTDVYSLGVVLYELLTTEVPFPGENFVAVAMRHINEPPPPVRDKRPDVSPRLEAAIQRAMAKRPEDRFPTMAAFCEELGACLAEAQNAGTQVVRPARGAPAPPRRRAARRGPSPWPVLVAIVALIAIGGVVAYLILDGFPTTKHGNGGGGKNPPLPTGGAITLKAVGVYDPPPGDGHENNNQIPNATDGIASTAWSTEDYHDPPSLNKPGVGLVLEASRSVTLHQLGFSTDTPGFVAEILAGNAPTGPFMNHIVGASQTTSSRTRYTITGGPYRYYVIWITRLGGGGIEHADVNE